MQYTKPEYDYKHPIFKHRAYIRYAQEHKEMYETLRQSSVIDYEIEKTVSPLQIPVVYLVHFNIKSIVGIDAENNPIYDNKHTLRLEIPTEYPRESSIVYMVTDAWHPNIKSEGKLKGRICANSRLFGRNFTLPQMVLRVGEILQYKNYLAEFRKPYPEDPKVAEWVLKYAEPNGIVDIKKGIYVDDTPLLAKKEAADEVIQGKAPEDIPPDTTDGFTFEIRKSDQADQVRGRITIGENEAKTADKNPNPATENPDDKVGFNITKRN